MEKPTECKWCGCGSVYSVSDRHVKFTCRSAWTADGDCWACSSQCCDEMRDRIQRAIETLKAAKRYTVTAGARNTLDWDRNPDGSVTDSAEVDEALAILEGERDGETWHPYTEPPSDTRSVMLRFDPAGNHDCQGFYSYDFGSYARNQTRLMQLRFLHPTHWRELTEEEK